MEFQYYGANCLRLTTKKATIVVDDNLKTLGLKSVTKDSDIAISTFDTTESASAARLTLDQPGEYEVSDISVQGVAARSHMDEADKQSATIFKLLADDIRVVVTGHIWPELKDEQLEAIGQVDVLIIPVGGSGYTLDGVDALKLIKKIEPSIVIPTHYADKAIKYEVPQQTLEEALKDLAMEPKETVAKLKLKPTDITENTELIVLERQ